MSKKPVVLAILDGYGESQYKDGNAIYTAKTPRLVPAELYIRSLPELPNL